MRTAFLVLLSAFIAFGCAYPRRSTFIHPAPLALVKPDDRPKDLWTIRFIGAELPQFKATGLPWDSDKTDPDPFIRLVVDKRVVWESPVQKDTRRPEWNITLPRNVEIPENATVRIELWDRDTAVSADPAGSASHTGLPENALQDATARVTLDNLAVVTLMVSAPRAHQGVGLHFEVRPDAIIVLDVEPRSPAGRAGIRKGERIVAIGGRRVAAQSSDEAQSGLSLASERGLTLTIADAKGHEREVTLDKGVTWLVM
jgi:hypothetical protein